MKLGTAKVTFENGAWIVRWMNVGSFLQNEPRGFGTELEARVWCMSRGLRIA